MSKAIFLIILIFPIWGLSQTPPSTSPAAPAPATPAQPQPQAHPQPNPNPPSTTQNRRSLGSLSKAEEDLALIDEQRVKSEKRKLARELIDELYRKPSKKELSAVAIDDQLEQKYAEFLRQENTGLFKFLNQSGCGGGSNVVTANDDCLNKMPGAGASYSFRIDNYRIPQLSDLSFAEKMFVTAGQWLHGLLLEIGDVPLENVSLEGKEVQALHKFQAATDIETAQKLDAKLLEGVRHEGFIYQRVLPARENTTYLLRSIAYRGTVNKTAQGFVYNELDYDKRKDILIAFRIVQTDSDGNVTILWKQLSAKDAPKIQ